MIKLNAFKLSVACLSGLAFVLSVCAPLAAGDSVESSRNALLAENHITDKFYEHAREFDGKGNYALAYACLLRAAQENADSVPQACFMLAEYSFHGRKGVAIDKALAKNCYSRAADGMKSTSGAQSPEALYMEGMRVWYGQGNEYEAIKSIEKAAEVGYLPAQVQSAFYYMKFGGSQYDKMLKWAQAAADKNDMSGKAMLRTYYLKVKKDASKGFSLIHESAQAGNASGQFMMACCYENGLGVEKNLPKAVEMLQLAADQGLDDAVWLLRGKKQLLDMRNSKAPKKSPADNPKK